MPDQTDGAIHGMGFSGPEGGVDVYWGTGFGGACPAGTVSVQVAEDELPACYVVKADGTEVWSQIGYEVEGGNSFRCAPPRAMPSRPAATRYSRCLATLTFMPPAEQRRHCRGGLANPASQNCVGKGGTLTIEQRRDGGQYGVCYFEDNMQCEEWALMRGDCPVGGVKVTGYTTPAATYCAITGGDVCRHGQQRRGRRAGHLHVQRRYACDARDYYDGQCS